MTDCMSMFSQRIEAITRGATATVIGRVKARDRIGGLELATSPIMLARHYGIGSGLLPDIPRHPLNGSLGALAEPWRSPRAVLSRLTQVVLVARGAVS